MSSPVGRSWEAGGDCQKIDGLLGFTFARQMKVVVVYYDRGESRGKIRQEANHDC